jgi:hypothetical protein
MGDHAETVESLEMIGRGRAHLPIQALGLDESARLMVRYRLREVLIERVRRMGTHLAG